MRIVLAPLVGPETVVVSMQNGMNPPRIAARISASRVVGVFVSLPADWQGPGHIEHGGYGDVWIGELDGKATPRREKIRSLLAHVAKAHTTDNIYGYLWSKQIDSSILYAQAVTDGTFAEVHGDKRYQPVQIALLGEGVGVAQAAGIKLESFRDFEPLKMRPRTEAEIAEARAVLDRLAEVAKTQVKVRSGIWRDLAVRHRPTEVDYMLGSVVAEGKRLGVPVPLSERLLKQVKEIESGRRNRGFENLEELEQYRKKVYGTSIGPH